MYSDSRLVLNFTSDDRKYARGSSKFCASGGGVDYDRDLCMVVVEGRGEGVSIKISGEFEFVHMFRPKILQSYEEVIRSLLPVLKLEVQNLQASSCCVTCDISVFAVLSGGRYIY